MSTNPHQTSSERSTAQGGDANGSQRSENHDGYSESPVRHHPHANQNGGGGGAPNGAAARASVSTSAPLYHNGGDQRYPGPSGHEADRRLSNGHVSYPPSSGPGSGYNTNANANSSSNSHPPPLRTSSSASHLPQPPIATLDSITTSPTTATAQPLKKRKSMYEQQASPTTSSSPAGSTPGASSSAAASAAAAQQAAKDAVKRTKTSRACDPCRRKKIRCDVLQGTEPPICAHCKQYGFDCTFFLPITETRWKKRKLEEDEAAGQSSSSSPVQQRAPSSVPVSRAPTRSDSITSAAIASIPLRRESSDLQSPSTTTPAPRGENTRIYGPTSLTYILHSSSTMPAVDSFDLRYHQTWRVGRSGEGFIQIHEQDEVNAPEDEDDEGNPRRRQDVEGEVLTQLVNYYFSEIAPYFPVITQKEFLHGSTEDHQRSGDQPYNPPTVLLYAICTIAATARHVPFRVFDTLRIMLNTVIRSEDVLSTATLSNIQALLIAGMTAEAHGRVPSQAMSAAWLRVSAAIRMAQDLGLHRAEAVKTDIELRRRLWAACVIQDRWYALTLGLPHTIDVQDCDARMPSLETNPPGNSLSPPPPPLTPEQALESKSLKFMAEMVRLAVLSGRVTKAIYSPTGLIHTTDETLEALQHDLEGFMARCPPELVLRDPEDPNADVFAGLLHMCHTCVGMMFWRVFARIQYTIPVHLKFAITVEAWSGLTVESAKAIRWLERNERIYDSWMIVAYAVTSCALVQYHTWARRSDEDAQDHLMRVRDTTKRWSAKVDPGHMLTRRKTTEIISLLYEATTSPVPRNFWPLNPTAGVEARNSAQADAIVFRKDPTRPGGGMFIATQRTASALGEDMPEGTVVVPDVPAVFGAPPASSSSSMQEDHAESSSQGAMNGHGHGMHPQHHHYQQQYAGHGHGGGGDMHMHGSMHSMPLVYGRDGRDMNPEFMSPQDGSGYMNTLGLQDQSQPGSGSFLTRPPDYPPPYYIPDHTQSSYPPPPPR